MLPRLPPPPIVPEATRRGTGGRLVGPIITVPPPPPIGTPPSVKSTPPDSPASADEVVVQAESAPPPQLSRSTLYSSMPTLIDTSDRSSGGRLALGAQRWTRTKPAATPSPLAQPPATAPQPIPTPSQPTPTPPQNIPPPLTKAQSIDVPPPSLATRASNSGTISGHRSGVASPPTSPRQSPRATMSPVGSPPTSPRPQSPPTSPRMTGSTNDWVSSKGTKSPPSSPPRVASPPRGAVIIPERNPVRRTGFYSPPDRSRSPPPHAASSGSGKIRHFATFRGVFDDRSATLSIAAPPDKILHPPVFGVSLRQQNDKDKEKDVPTFLSRLVTRIRSHDDIAKEIYWIDSEFEPSIDNLQFALSKDYPDNALNFEGVGTRTLTGLLKRYFMFLVEPLIPHEIYERLAPLRVMHQVTLRTHFMGSVICSLNSAHRSVIMFMLQFLQDVLRAEYGIGIDKLSRAFGMVFFRAKMAFPSDEVKKVFQQGCAQVVEMLLTQVEDLVVRDANLLTLLTAQNLDVSYSADGVGLVLSATPQSLMYKLVDPVYRDPEFTDIFFCCRDYLGLSEQGLLELFIDMLAVATEEPLDEMRLTLRMRTFEVIQKWIKSYDGIVSDPPALALYHQWVNTLVPQFDEEVKVMEDLAALSVPAPPAKPSALRFLTGSQPMMRIQNVLQLEPDDIAIQLTLREFDILKTLPVSELLNKNFTREAKSPKWQASVASYNRLASWVAQQIVIRKESMEARVKVLTKLIAVCEALLRLNNYNSLFALLGGLNNPGVNRLTQSWEKVPKKGLKAFKMLMVLFDPGQNYRAYRDSIANAKPPFVPYLALLGKWLFAIEENNTTNLADKPNVVNFDKMRNIYKVVSQIRYARDGEYRFIEHPDVNTLLNNEVILTDDEIYERSLQCEARGK